MNYSKQVNTESFKNLKNKYLWGTSWIRRTFIIRPNTWSYFGKTMLRCCKQACARKYCPHYTTEEQFEITH